jgi:hypothetical protein
MRAAIAVRHHTKPHVNKRWPGRFPPGLVGSIQWPALPAAPAPVRPYGSNEVQLFISGLVANLGQGGKEPVAAEVTE